MRTVGLYLNGVPWCGGLLISLLLRSCTKYVILIRVLNLVMGGWVIPTRYVSDTVKLLFVQMK